MNYKLYIVVYINFYKNMKEKRNGSMSNIKDKMLEFDRILLEQLQEYGFAKKGKHEFRRKQGECLQHISIADNKVRGEDKVHIDVNIGFKYEQLDKIISYLKNEKYDKKWPTADINLFGIIGTNNVYGFYIDEYTDLVQIINDIMSALVNFGFDFLEKCNTVEKFEQMLIKKDKTVQISTFALEKPEWNLLALSILLEHLSVDEIVKEYEPDFMRNKVQWDIAKKRISTYEAIKENL